MWEEFSVMQKWATRKVCKPIKIIIPKKINASFIVASSKLTQLIKQARHEFSLFRSYSEEMQIMNVEVI